MLTQEARRKSQRVILANDAKFALFFGISLGSGALQNACGFKFQREDVKLFNLKNQSRLFHRLRKVTWKKVVTCCN